MVSHAKKAQPKIKQSLKCPTCDFETKESYYAKQELGRHMKFVHGVNGRTAPSKPAEQVEKKQRTYKKRLTNAAKADIAAAAGKTERLLNGEAQAFITVGRIIAYCEVEAKKLGVSEESFTRRCAEYFFASQVRQ